MLRWGANANLGRIYESKKDNRPRSRLPTQHDPTTQFIGNLLRARELVWMDPMSATVTLPPAPPPKPVVRRPPPPPASRPRPPAKAGN